MFEKEELKKIKGFLTEKHKQDLCEEFGIVNSTLKNILNGCHNNQQVLIRAAEMSLAEKLRIESLKNQING